jgi:hypothetical protein
MTLVMGAKIEAVYMCTERPKHLLEFGLNGLHIFCRVESQGNAALVRDHGDANPRTVEVGNGLHHSGANLKLAPAGHIVAFRHLFVKNAVAVNENRL